MEQQIEELSRCSADILSKQIWYGLSELCSCFECLGLIIIKFPICRLISRKILLLISLNTRETSEPDSQMASIVMHL